MFQRGHLQVPSHPKACTGCPSSARLSQAVAAQLRSPPPGWLVPVVPVEVFEVFIVRDVYLINLPGALVVGQVFPLDQVMDVSLFIKAVMQGVKSLSVK